MHTLPPTPAPPQGVRFKRLIMDESSTDRSFDPPKQPDVGRMVLCSGKVRPQEGAGGAVVCMNVCGGVCVGGGGGGGGRGCHALPVQLQAAPPRKALQRRRLLVSMAGFPVLAPRPASCQYERLYRF
jgi:hypothetical protein